MNENVTRQYTSYRIGQEGALHDEIGTPITLAFYTRRSWDKLGIGSIGV